MDKLVRAAFDSLGGSVTHRLFAKYYFIVARTTLQEANIPK